MKHAVYRNLQSRDTLFGLDIIDFFILAIVLNLVFRFHQTSTWSGKLLNVALVGLTYLILALCKRQFPKGYLHNLGTFLFKPRIFLPTEDQSLKPIQWIKYL